MKELSENKSISVIGLGQMGRKLAEIYLAAGFEVTVWNRDPDKIKTLPKVIPASSPHEAIGKSDIVLVCVYDNAAVSAIFDMVGDAEIFNGKTIVNLTTGSPKEVEALEQRLNQAGASYLNGAIQVAPEQMALPTTTILMAGDEKAFEEQRSLLELLGGNIKHLHQNAAASAAMDLATLTWLYGAYVGLMYGVKLCQAFGLDLSDYSSIIGEITPGFTDFFKHEIAMVKAGNLEITQSPLSISVSATQRIANALEQLPVAQEFPQLIAGILKRAEVAGLGEKELASIIEVIGDPKANNG